MKAEYLSYCMVSIMPSLVEGLKKYVLNSTTNLIYHFIFFNVDSSFNIKIKVLKCSMLVLHIVIEGTVSQILYLGPSFCFM